MVPYAIFKSLSIYAIVAFSFMTRFCLLVFSYVRLSPLFLHWTNARRSTFPSSTKPVAVTRPLSLA